MENIGRALIVCGLVLTTGPLSFHTVAQDYIDVEAERAAQRASSGAVEDPYRVKPAQQYPATSYGVNTGAARSTATATAPVQSSGGAAAVPASALPSRPPSGAGIGSQNQNLGNLVYQIQQLQQEVMTLNGRVEKQAYELRRLQQQLDDRYQDLDRRLGGTGSVGAGVGAGVGASVVTGSAGSSSSAPVSGAKSTPPKASSPQKARTAQPPRAEQPGEGEAYRAAYALVRGQQWDAAISAFDKFLQQYPAGRYAPNAHYWLGELYLVTQPPQLESARQAFMLLLSEYPDNNKAPDAMYKLGKVYFQKGNRARGREYLDRVISEYGNTNSSAVQLSREFIAENY
jgi:tol-pal system protein YbgF